MSGPDEDSRLSFQLISLQEACEYLNLTRWTIRDMITRGELETVKVGRRLRIRWSSIQKLVEKPSQAAGDE